MKFCSSATNGVHIERNPKNWEALGPPPRGIYDVEHLKYVCTFICHHKETVHETLATDSLVAYVQRETRIILNKQ